MSIQQILVDKINELEAENRALTQQLEYFDKHDQVGTWLKDMITMLAMHVEDPGAAKNYVEFTMNWDEGVLAKLPFRQVAVIFYRDGGKSPHTMLKDARAELDDANAQVTRVEQRLDEICKNEVRKGEPLAGFERKIVAALLDMAGDTFSNHGCNDFDLDALGVTKKQAAELDKQYQEFNNSPEDHDPDVDHRQQTDWTLMNYFAWRLGHR